MSWGIVGSIGGAVIGAAGSIIGGKKQQEAAEKQIESQDAGLDKQLQFNQNTLDRSIELGEETRDNQLRIAQDTRDANFNVFQEGLDRQLATNESTLNNQLAASNTTFESQLGVLTQVFDLVLEQSGKNRADIESSLGAWRDIGLDAIDSIRADYDNGDLQSPKYQKFQIGNYNPAEYDREFNPEAFTKNYKTAAFEFEKDPGYEFRRREGEKALERQGAAGGNLQSGAYDKAIVRYNQDYASDEYQNAFNRHLATTDRDFRDFQNEENVFRRNQADLRNDDIIDYGRFQVGEDNRRDDFYRNQSLNYQDHTNAFNAENMRSNTEFGRRMDLVNGGRGAATNLASLNNSNNNLLSGVYQNLGNQAVNAYGNQGSNVYNAFGAQGTNEANIIGNTVRNVAANEGNLGANLGNAWGQYGTSASGATQLAGQNAGNFIGSNVFANSNSLNNIGNAQANTIGGVATAANTGLENLLTNVAASGGGSGNDGNLWGEFIKFAGSNR